MCGIATIAIGRGNRGRISYPLLRKFIKELLAELQPRGLDASGIAVLNRGAPSQAYKLPLRPSRFVEREKFFPFLESNITDKTDFIMLHARATSVGNTEDNVNNHPIIAGPIVGIHNGTLYNHEKLFSAFSADIDREGDVDSEVIFRLYGHFVDNGYPPDEAIYETAKLLDGAYTGGLVDLREPSRMVMFKNDRPLCLLRLGYYDIAIAVSEARFYDNAASAVGMKAKTSCHYANNGTGLVFDLEKPGKLVDNIRDFQIPATPKNHRYLGKGVSGIGW
jgi:glucosamine 6-phosphate synthetase-like amidotransferase/phosphosugar isomerase protein